MIDVLWSQNLQRLDKGDQTKPADVKDLAIWEDLCDQARGIIGQTISDSLHVYIETGDNLIKVWKTLFSLC